MSELSQLVDDENRDPTLWNRVEAKLALYERMREALRSALVCRDMCCEFCEEERQVLAEADAIEESCSS